MAVDGCMVEGISIYVNRITTSQSRICDEGREIGYRIVVNPQFDRLINPAKAEILVMAFSPRSSNLRLVNLARGEMSDIELFKRSSSIRRFNPDKGRRSVMLFPGSHSRMRLVAYSSPVKLRMFPLVPSRSAIHAMSATVMLAFSALPSLFAITTRRLKSGMDTTCAVAVTGMEM